MSIASAIQNAQTKVAVAYTAISNKGGTLPATQNLSNMPTAISSIPSGGDTPTLITKNITQNGTYNASSDNADGYSSVTVNVSGGSSIGIPREVKNSVYQMPTESFTFSLPSDATDIGSNGLQNAFNGCSHLTSVDLSSLNTISGNYAFANAFNSCRGLTTVDLSALTTVSGSQGFGNAFRECTSLASINLSALTTVSGTNGFSNAFYNCTGLTRVDLSSLTTVGNYGLSGAFQNCTGLTSVDLSALTTVGNNGLSTAFQSCTGLTSVDLSSLTTVSGSNGLQGTFRSCTKLTDIYFRALTTSSFGSYNNQFKNMMQTTGTTTTHTLHFPSNLESTISGLTGYPLFGGTDGYVVLAFDLPATK